MKTLKRSEIEHSSSTFGVKRGRALPVALIFLAAVTIGGAPSARAAEETAAPSLSLDDCLKSALTGASLQEHDRLLVDIADRHVAAAKASRRPVVKGSLSARVTSQDQIATSTGGSDAGTSTLLTNRARALAGVDATFPLADGGLGRSTVDLTQEQLRQARDTAVNGRVTTLNEVVTSYYALLQKQRITASEQLNITTLQELERAATARLGLGQVTKGDVLTAQSARAQAQALLQTDILARDVARAHLARLIGQDPVRANFVVADLPAGPDLTETVDDIMARQVKTDPAYDVLVSQKNTSEITIAQIRAQRANKLTLTLGAGAISQTVSNHSNGSAIKPYVTAGINYSIPLSDGGGKEREQAQRDDVQLKQMAIDSYQSTVKEQVADAYSRYRIYSGNIDAVQTAVSAAEESLRLAQGRYQAGTGTQSDVLTAVRGVNLARSLQADTLNQRDAAARDLRVIAGTDASAAYLAVPGPIAPSHAGANP